jgi:hypothetical protein
VLYPSGPFKRRRLRHLSRRLTLGGKPRRQDATFSLEGFRKVVSDQSKLRLFQCRRAQRVYAEIVQASFPQLSTEMIYFPNTADPLEVDGPPARAAKFDNCVSLGGLLRHGKTAGADVSFTDKAVNAMPDWKATRDALVKLGRPGNLPAFAGSTLEVPYDGTTLNGHFSGATPVTNEICSWLEDELKHLFRDLPSSDGAF